MSDDIRDAEVWQLSVYFQEKGKLQVVSRFLFIERLSERERHGK